MEHTRKIRSNGSLRVTLWNTAGLGKANEFMDFLEESQIVILQETWILKEKEEEVRKRLSDKFIWHFKSAQ